MTPRERMLTAIDGGVPDRVPLDIWATAEVWAKLREHFGVADNTAVRDLLHVDGFHGVDATYVGPEVPTHPDGVTENYWGMRHRPQSYGTGVYHEQFHYPLSYAETVADLDDYRWPSVDWFDFSGIRARCEQLGDRPIMAGYSCPFFYLNLLRGLEQSLLDLAANPELAHAVVDRLTDYFCAYAERLYEAGGGLIDIGQLTDDFGGQTNLLISMDMFNEFFLEPYRRIAEVMHRHKVRVFHHDDGAMWELIPTLIDLGVAVINPIQYRSGSIDPGWLNDTYGDRIAFHGGVDNQEVLPFGTVDDVIAETRKCLDTLGAGGGYILAPCHNLQAVSPVENIVAMYQTAYEEGGYE